MVIIIDGYNLIKQIFSVSKISEKKRDSYVSQLVKKTQPKGHKLVVVFDGGTYNFPHTQEFNSHTLIFSGYKESADDVIKQYVGDNRNLDLLVVTSDREIRNFVHNLGVQTIDSQGFNRIIENTSNNTKSVIISSHTPPVKTTREKNPELDALMSEVHGTVEKNDEKKVERTSKSQKESKKSKKLRKKLEKI